MNLSRKILQAAAVVALGVSSATAESYQVGVCAYTFRQFTAFEAIDKTKEAGGEVIEFFLWQKLSPEHPDVILNENLADGHIAALKAKLESAGIKAVNAYFSDAAFKDPAHVEERLHRLFGFARKLGLRGLTGEPPADQLDLIEKMVKEYDIQLCFHNHPKDPKRPDYRNWDPAYLLSLMDGRDPRMGFCLDVGHIVRSGLDPVEAVRLFGKRLHSVHLKDVKDATTGAPDGPYGEGVGNLAGVLAELKKTGFSGHVAVECDRIPEPLMEGVARNIAFIREH